MMRIDVFQFHNELEMLRCRAHELDGLVDQHIAVEANRTKSGRRRKYALRGDEVPNLTVVRADVSDVSDVTLGYDVHKAVQRPGYTPVFYPYAENWERDWKQREAVRPLIDDLPDDAVILYGDIDEIPRRSIVEAFDSPVVGLMRMRLLLYGTGWTGGTWDGTTIGTKEAYHGASFAQARAGRGGYPAIEEAGWHLSWFGGREAVFEKVQANAHAELTEDLEALDRQYDERIWPGGTVKLWRYEGDLPKYVEDGLAPEVWAG